MLHDSTLSRPTSSPRASSICLASWQTLSSFLSLVCILLVSFLGLVWARHWSSPPCVSSCFSLLDGWLASTRFVTAFFWFHRLQVFHRRMLVWLFLYCSWPLSHFRSCHHSHDFGHHFLLCVRCRSHGRCEFGTALCFFRLSSAYFVLLFRFPSFQPQLSLIIGPVLLTLFILFGGLYVNNGLPLPRLFWCLLCPLPHSFVCLSLFIQFLFTGFVQICFCSLSTPCNSVMFCLFVDPICVSSEFVAALHLRLCCESVIFFLLLSLVLFEFLGPADLDALDQLISLCIRHHLCGRNEWPDIYVQFKWTNSCLVSWHH